MQTVFDQHDVRLIITGGDNIYAGTRILGLPIGSNTGDEDDDWFFTFFQPYRYMINRVAVYPCIDNHDTAETEDRDDREQLLDNMYLRERIASDEASGRASVDPGLFYRFRYGRDVEFICIDTSKESFFRHKRLFQYPKHWQRIEQTFASGQDVRWRIPFCHHPPFCAGPRHHNTDDMEMLLPLFRAGGRPRRLQRPRAQLPALAPRGHRLLRHRRRQQGAERDAGRLRGAHTLSWADEAHFLLVTIAGGTMTVRPIGEAMGGVPQDLERRLPDGTPLRGPIVIAR